MSDIVRDNSTEIHILIKHVPFVEVIKQAACQLSKRYGGNIKIEINVHKCSNEVKCSVTEYDL